MPGLTHFDDAGLPRIVDVGPKPITLRQAWARGWVRMDPSTLDRILAGSMGKGDVLGTARLAGVMAAKRTANLIPLCHTIALDGLELDFAPASAERLQIDAHVRCHGRTGVEMEALTAVTVAALTVYDMCKAVDRAMTLEEIRLEAKTGGASGDFRRESP